MLRKHVDNGAGRCCGCTMPGTGTPYERWPCPIYTFASAALDVAEAAGRRLEAELAARTTSE